MYDVAIVGAGIFGCVIGRALYDKGYSVIGVDDGRAEAGSPPAACLMKPSWFSSLGKDVYDPALAKLAALYDLQETDVLVGPTSKRMTVFWIKPSNILADPRMLVLSATVSALRHEDNRWILYGGREVIITARAVIIAAGIWTEKLIPSIKQTGQAGMAFLWSDLVVPNPRIKVWAPYKQMVKFNRGDGLWIGDGSAIKRQNWTEQHAARSLGRAVAFLGSGDYGAPKKLFGIRPYYPAKPALLKNIDRGLWVASGGAKNGTLAAGWCASVLADRVDLYGDNRLEASQG